MIETILARRALAGIVLSLALGGAHPAAAAADAPLVLTGPDPVRSATRSSLAPGGDPAGAATGASLPGGGTPVRAATEAAQALPALGAPSAPVPPRGEAARSGVFVSQLEPDRAEPREERRQDRERARDERRDQRQEERDRARDERREQRQEERDRARDERRDERREDRQEMRDLPREERLRRREERREQRQRGDREDRAGD